MVHALQVRAAGQSYALPFAAIRQSIALPATTEPGASGQASLPRRVRVRLAEREAELRVHTLAELLGYRAIDAVPVVPRIGLVVEFGRGPAVVAVEAMEGDGEIVVRRLSPHLRRRAVRGASVTPAGEVLLLLDLAELAARASGVGLTGPLRPPPRPPVATGPVVLVVDDSLTIRRAIEATLTRAGCVVEVARDGMEALERMLTIVPRVLILDIEMPNLNGFDLLRTLRAQEQYAGIRVAMLTSRGTERHRRHALELGADAYLVKPCPEVELVATVRGLLARPE
jgi:chemosensory pili system protein ChpA (sensor histidine kinase/response regulator)